MNKDDFFKAVNDLSLSRGYASSNEWDKERGFKECKEKVLKLIPELDIEGMSPDSFALFRNAMNDLTNLYREMFQLQKQLQDANKVIIDLQIQLTEKNKDIRKKEKQCEAVL